MVYVFGIRLARISVRMPHPKGGAKRRNKRMNKVKYILFLAMAGQMAMAQTAEQGGADPQGAVWSMDRCIQYAVEHTNSMGRERLEQQQLTADVKTAKLAFLPTVTANISGQYSWGRNVDPETNTYNTITTFNNYYNIGAEMTLFDGGQTWLALKKARLARQNSETQLQKLADDKAVVVMAKYVEALYNQKAIALAEQKLADSRALLHKTRRLYELGEKARPDVVQIESEVADDSYNLVHQQNTAALSLLALKQEMNYPAAEPLVLDTLAAVEALAFSESPVVLDGKSATSTKVKGGLLPGKRPSFTDEKGIFYDEKGHLLPSPSPSLDDASQLFNTFQQASPDLQTALFKMKDAELDYRTERGRNLPTVTLGGGVSTNYYKNLTSGAKAPDPFGRQFHNNMGEFVYLQVAIPIFVPKKWQAVRRAKTRWQQAQLDLADARKKLYSDIAQAIADRDGALQELEMARKKVESAAVAYQLSYRKYEEGMLSTFDLHAAAETLQQSRIKLLQVRLTLEMKQRLVNYYKGGGFLGE